MYWKDTFTETVKIKIQIQFFFNSIAFFMLCHILSVAEKVRKHSLLFQLEKKCHHKQRNKTMCVHKPFFILICGNTFLSAVAYQSTVWEASCSHILLPVYLPSLSICPEHVRERSHRKMMMLWWQSIVLHTHSHTNTPRVTHFLRTTLFQKAPHPTVSTFK